MARPAANPYNLDDPARTKLNSRDTALLDYVDEVSADASTSTKGRVVLSTTPAVPANPIAISATDTILPTQAENDALQGTSGSPSSTNKYVTASDPVLPTQSENDALQGTNGSPSNTNRYVTNTDSRLTDARTPTTHTHTTADITDYTRVSVNPQTGTTYTPVLSDAGKIIEMNNASANTFTIPPNSSVAYPVNTVMEVFQYGAGVTSVVAGAGVTIPPSSAAVAVSARYKSLRLRQRAANEWIVE
jgi:hypothetical protein